MTAGSPTRWRCPCCGWYIKGNCSVHRDAESAYVRRVRRALEVRIRRLHADECLWCDARFAEGALRAQVPQ